jgi:hypothetical protein
MLWLLVQREVRNLELEGNSENLRLCSIRRCSVKQSRGIRLDRIILLKAMLLAATLVPALGLPVYGQQEVDPTWYDPWATQTRVCRAACEVANAQPRASAAYQYFLASPSKKTRVKLAGGQPQGVVVTRHSQK